MIVSCRGVAGKRTGGRGPGGGGGGRGGVRRKYMFLRANMLVDCIDR